MAGFLDVVFRGVVLFCASLVLGGVAWARLVLGAEPHAKPEASTRVALRLTAAGAWAAALAQAAVLAVALVELAGHLETWPLALFLGTTYAQMGLARVALALVAGVLAWRLAGRAGGRAAWSALTAGATLLVAGSAALSHAMARVDWRGPLLVLDAAHQVAAALWVGGLAHLLVHAAGARERSPEAEAAVLRRFSRLALGAVTVLAAAGVGLTLLYVDSWAAMVGTGYGVMVLTKVVLFLAVLGVAQANFRAVRRDRADLRLRRFVEVELGLAATVLFAAAALTGLPPAADVTADRANLGEVAARFTPGWPRLSSPQAAELIAQAEPLMGPVTRREPVEIAWSEYNHHWAGLFVLAMGLLALAERAGVRSARHWPLLFLGLAVFMFLRSDPRAWPLGPAGFWESMTLPDVLQHRLALLLVVAFGGFEWMVRTGRLPARPWARVFPLLAAVGGGLLLTHSHAMFNLKSEFLVEVTHAPLGVLGAFAGWARWLEVRLPEAGPVPGWLWRACLVGVGILLVFYREA